MLVIDNGDAIRGIAEVASKLDFIVNGYVGTTATQLADGQLGVAEADMYLSGANGIVVTSIIVVNTDSVARTFTLYLKPSAGTSRAITPVLLDLPASYSFYTDGQRMVVMSTTGEVIQVYPYHAATHQNGGADEISVAGLSGLLADDQHVLDAEVIAAAIDKTIQTTKGDLLVATGASTPVRRGVGANDTVLTADSAEADGVKWAAGSLAVSNFAAGDYLLISMEVLDGGAPTTYTKQKEVKLKSGGSLRIKFTLVTASSSYGVYGRIYRNGVAVGTERFLASNWTATEYSEDISGWSKDDLCQLYTHSDGTVDALAKWEKLRLYTLYDRKIGVEVNLDG